MCHPLTSLTLTRPCQASLQCSWGSCRVVRYCNLPPLVIAGLTHSLNKCKEDVTHEGRVCNQMRTLHGYAQSDVRTGRHAEAICTACVEGARVWLEEPRGT